MPLDGFDIHWILRSLKNARGSHPQQLIYELVHMLFEYSLSHHMKLSPFVWKTYMSSTSSCSQKTHDFLSSSNSSLSSSLTDPWEVLSIVTAFVHLFLPKFYTYCWLTVLLKVAESLYHSPNVSASCSSGSSSRMSFLMLWFNFLECYARGFLSLRQLNDSRLLVEINQVQATTITAH
jgi:hypothetical protein